MSLSECTRYQLPVLEASLRQWRLSNISESDSPESVQRRRIDREAARLLSLVVVLREEMSKGNERLNAVNAVLPFIEVARSPLAGTEAKSAAVECLGRLVDSMFESDEGAVEALSAVTEAVLECRFEQTNSDADEVAMMWLLETLGKCANLQGVGKLLSDDVLFRVIETMYDGCTVPFNTDTIRAIALKLTTSLLRNLFAQAPFGPMGGDSTSSSSNESDQLDTIKQEDDATNPVDAPTANTTLAARKAFQFLVEMADPEHVQQAHVIGTWGRFVALRLLVEATSAAIVVGSTLGRGEIRIMKDPFIASIVRDDLMRTLIQTAQQVGSTFNSPAALEDPNRLMIIMESLRLANTLLGHPSSRREMKIQFECFYNAVYARVLEKSASRKIARPDEAALVIESLCDLLSDPTILCDCYAAFDLHLQSTDVFENTFKLFSRLAFPHHTPGLDAFRLLSLRGLLVSLRSLTVSKDIVENEELWQEEERHAKELKARKHALHRCAEAFNAKPKQGVQTLKDEGVLNDPPDPLVLASFLRNTPTLEKVAIGQFLGEDGELNRAVLRSFTETFDVRNRPLVSSLRTFLECFRLPKEAQQIDRIVQVFADIAMAQCSDAGYFPSVDACYILCFAIIMLNTDLHNPNIRSEKKMTQQQFIANNRNYGMEVSKGVDLPAEFLSSIYADIAKREINTMKDGSGITAEVSKDRWHDLLARAKDSSDLGPTIALVKQQHRQSSDVALFGYKKCMFEAVWRPALAAVSVVFDSGQASEQPDALHAALDGFLILAKAAARFKCIDAFDSVVAALCKFTSLLMYGSSQVDLVDGSKAYQTALRDFGNHHKGQMAAMSVFALSRRFGSDMRKSWRHVLWCVLRWNDLKLLPDTFRSEELALLDGTSRSLFHRKMRDAITKAFDARSNSSSISHNKTGSKTDGSSATTNTTMTMTRGLSQSDSTSSSSSSSLGWGFTSWLFGTEEENAKAARKLRLENDPEYRALMSAIKVADSFCSLENNTAKSAKRRHSQLGSPKGSQHSTSPKASPRREQHESTTSDLPSTGHSNRKFADNSDVLDVEETDDILSRADEATYASSQYAIECVRSCRPFTIIGESKSLSDDALACLIDALFHALGMTIERSASIADESPSTSMPPMSPSPSQSKFDDLDLGVENLAPPSSGSRLIAVHLLAELVLRNAHRFDLVFPRVSRGLFELLRMSPGPSFQVELACVGLLRISSAMFDIAPEQLVVTLQRLVETCSVAPGLDFILGRTVLDMVSSSTRPDIFWLMDQQQHSSQQENPTQAMRMPRCGWGEFFSLCEIMSSASPVAAAFAFDALKFAISHSNGGLENTPSAIVECTRTAASFALIRWPTGEQQTKEVSAVDLVFSLVDSCAKTFASSKTLTLNEYVPEMFIPILGELSRIAQNEFVTVAAKKRAFSLIQRACLNGSEFRASDWMAVLECVILPLCSSTLRENESGPSSPLVRGGEAKSMVAACELLAKVVLAFSPVLAKLERFPELWVEVLQYLERFKQAGLIRASGGEPEGNVLSETVTELVKNLLLSLSAEGILSPTARVVATGQPLQESDVMPAPNSPPSLLWEMSWAVIDRSPGLRSELFALDDAIDLRETPTKELQVEVTQGTEVEATIGNDETEQAPQTPTMEQESSSASLEPSENQDEAVEEEEEEAASPEETNEDEPQLEGDEAEVPNEEDDRDVAGDQEEEEDEEEEEEATAAVDETTGAVDEEDREDGVLITSEDVIEPKAENLTDQDQVPVQ